MGRKKGSAKKRKQRKQAAAKKQIMQNVCEGIRQCLAMNSGSAAGFWNPAFAAVQLLSPSDIAQSIKDGVRTRRLKIKFDVRSWYEAMIEAFVAAKDASMSLEALVKVVDLLDPMLSEFTGCTGHEANVARANALFKFEDFFHIWCKALNSMNDANREQAIMFCIPAELEARGCVDKDNWLHFDWFLPLISRKRKFYVGLECFKEDIEAFWQSQCLAFATVYHFSEKRRLTDEPKVTSMDTFSWSPIHEPKLIPTILAFLRPNDRPVGGLGDDQKNTDKCPLDGIMRALGSGHISLNFVRDVIGPIFEEGADPLRCPSPK